MPPWPPQGKARTPGVPPDKVVVMFRRWAVDSVLREDLTAYAKLTEKNNPTAKKTIQERLTYWRGDAGLTAVRDPQRLGRLPDNECRRRAISRRDVHVLLNVRRKQTAHRPRGNNSSL